jgi:hypothetical protein
MFAKKKETIIMTAAVLVLALALVAAKLPGADYGGRTLTADLSGAAEVPGPGDADGSGWAEITLNPGKETVCWHIMVSDITLPAIGAHIHEGTADVAGPVVVALSAPDESGMSSGCTTADRELIKEIMHEIDEYYVNVHTTDFPAGAVRGQLDK